LVGQKPKAKREEEEEEEGMAAPTP